MNWYYADQQQQKGPFNDNDFQNLVRQGVITDDTLVWREGMPEWLPYASISPAGVPSAAEASASACGVCGKSLPPQDLIQFEGVNVCAACKPAFLQKLKEDSTIPMQMEYAGFWIRFGAVFLDGLILSVPYYIVYFSP